MVHNLGINIINQGDELGSELLLWIKRQRYLIDKMRGGLMEDVRLLKVKEVMEVLRLSRSTVYRMIASGELAVIRIGRSIRISEETISKYFERIYDSGE